MKKSQNIGTKSAFTSKENGRKTIPKEIHKRKRESKRRIFGIFVHEIAKMRWVYL